MKFIITILLLCSVRVEATIISYDSFQNADSWVATQGNQLWLNGSLARTNMPFNVGPQREAGRMQLSTGSLLNQTNTASSTRSFGQSYTSGTYYFSFMFDSSSYIDNGSATIKIGNLSVGRFNNNDSVGLLAIDKNSNLIPDHIFSTQNPFNTHFYIIGLSLNEAGGDVGYAWLDPINHSSPDFTFLGEFSFNSIILNVRSYGAQSKAELDEIRFGDSLEDVFPSSTTISAMPEINTNSFLLLGLIFIFILRRLDINKI